MFDGSRMSLSAGVRLLQGSINNEIITHRE